MRAQPALILAATFLFLRTGPVDAKAAYIPLPQKAAASDLIARVNVLSISPAPAGSRYRGIARVRIVASIKGLAKGKEVDLEFDNGLACPNVRYAKGEDCLIFAARLQNGHFETYNTYFGKYFYRDGKVLGWMAEDFRSRDSPWTTVVNQLQSQLADRKP